MRMLYPILAAGMLMTGCAGSPVSLGMKSPDELKFVHSHDLCHAYGLTRSEKIRAELEARGASANREWAAIDQGKAGVGMSDLAFSGCFSRSQ